MNNTIKQWPAKAFTIHDDAETAQTVIVKGRDRWALEALIAAGVRGCTPITTPGPRWSAYVFKLRKMGVQIDTLHENHSGPFPGHHARYVLQSRVSPGRSCAQGGNTHG